MIILNKTAKQYNVKASSKTARITIRLAPGMTELSEGDFDVLKEDPYYKSLVKDDLVSSQKDGGNKDTPKAKVSSKPKPKPAKEDNK